MQMAYIGFGSNLGDLTANFERARQLLVQSANVTMLRASPLYYSEPLTCDGELQSWYLNGVLEISTTLSPHQLFYVLKGIEKTMGRIHSKRWTPRIVDLDLLFYDRVIYTDDVLTVPHPEVGNRLFVLRPLNDLNPEWRHPEFDMTVSEMLAVTGDKLQIRRVDATDARGEA